VQSDWPAIRPSRVTIDLLPYPTDGRLVSPGERVAMGQRVGRSAGLSALVSVDGTIADEPARPNRLAIDVDADFSQAPEPLHHDHHDRDAIATRLGTIRYADRGTWFDRLRTRGVIADRHACPQLHEQLRQALNRPIDTVLCCALDLESSLPFSSMLATRFATEMVVGTAMLSQLLGAPSAILAMDVRTPQRQLAAVRHWAGRSAVKLTRLVNRYPQCDPTLLLYTVLKRKLRPGLLPPSAGVLMIDAASAIAVGQTLITGAPMTSAFVAVHDVMSRKVARARVPVGTRVSNLLRQLGLGTNNLTLRAGELFGDVRVPADTPIGFGELTFHAAPAEPSIIPDPCVRCGWCVEICPTRVHPAGLLDAAQRLDPAMAERHGLHACIECGLCTYVCPSKLPLLQTIRGLRNPVKSQP
jgi:electron transport complex protein RnfC